MKYDPRELLRSFDRLAPRERMLLSVALVSTVAISFYSFVWDPFQVNRELVVRRIQVKEKDLQAIQRQRDLYFELDRKLQASQAATSEGDPDFNLFAYVQTAISQAVAREHITSLNPSNKNIGTDYLEQQVDIKLQQVGLQQIVDLVYRVEKGEHPLRFSRLQVKKRFSDIYNFDVSATVSLIKNVAKSQEKAPEKPAERVAG